MPSGQLSPDFAWQSSPSPVKLRYLRFAEGESVLDIGMGSGFYTQELQKAGYRVVGLDLAPQAKLALTAAVVQARASALPFRDAFDTVCAFDVLEHESEEAAALAELRRLTKRRLILSVPNADDPLLHRYNLTYKHHIDKTHHREYTVEALRTKLQNAGFSIIELKKEGPVRPALLGEFVRPSLLRRPVFLAIELLHRLRVLYQPDLMADLYAVAQPIP